MKVTTKFNPKIYEIMSGYNTERLVKDLGAGMTVAIVALPLAMAFAIASGLKPETGIFTAIIAGFLISLFSGSRVQIGGPAGAFIVIVYGIVERYGVGGLLLATFMSGIMLWVMGFFRMGILIKFIPVTVIIGFTNGIAVLIGISQVKDFLGLHIEGKTPAEFFALLHTLWNALPTWNPQALFLALLSLAIIILWQKSTQPGGGQSGGQSVGQNTQGVSAMLHRIRSTTPGSIIALLVATILAQLFHLDVETIGSRFGGIPQGLPSFTIPLPHAADGGWSLSVIWEAMKGLVAPAATLAVLGAIESLLCARVADNMIKDKHDSNQELLAQGFANMVVPFFGGMPATGTIARTVTNIKNGATSPVSGIIHALVLLVVVLVAAPLAQYIPLAALSAILMFVAYNMGEWHEFARLRSYRMTYRFILLAVFILTVVVDLTAAVEVGILAACFTLIYRVSYLSTEDQIDLSEWGEQADGVKARRLVGTLFFGAVKLIDQLQLDIPKRALVLDFSGVIYVDSSGAESLNELLEMYQEKAVPIYIYGLREQPLEMLTRTGWLKDLGQAYVCANLDEARQKIAAQGA